MPGRHISIEYVRLETHQTGPTMRGERGFVAFRITEQTHRNEDFAPNTGSSSSRFLASNGILLCSSNVPAISTTHPRERFYVRGSNEDADQKYIICSHEHFQRIREAVEEYNEVHSGDGAVRRVSRGDLREWMRVATAGQTGSIS